MIDKESVRNAALDDTVDAIRSMKSKPDQTIKQSGVIMAQQEDTISYVHPEYGPGIFFTEDCLIDQQAQPDYKVAYQEWSDKTDFIQEWVSKGVISAKYLGWHRADVMRDLIENSGITSRRGHD